MDLWSELAQEVLELNTGRGRENIMRKYMLGLLFAFIVLTQIHTHGTGITY